MKIFNMVVKFTMYALQFKTNALVQPLTLLSLNIISLTVCN